MKNKAPAFQFYVRDWLSDPQLKMASHQTKGIWIDLLCYMWESPKRGIIEGTISELCRLLGATEAEIQSFIDENNRLNFASVTVDNKKVTLVNRRMVRDDKHRNNNALRQARYKSNARGNAEVTPLSSSSSSKEKQTKRKKQPSPPGDCASVFELFWTAYPKKRSKGDAEKAWIKINPSEHLIEKILSAVQRAKTSVDWTKENGRYIPYPASWLNSKGWEDEYIQQGCEPSGDDRPSGTVPVRTYRDSDGNVRDVRTQEIIEPTSSGIPEQPGPALAIVQNLVTGLTGTGLRVVN